MINYGLSPLLFLWLCWSSYQQLLKQHDLRNQWYVFKESLLSQHSWELVLALILVFINWAIEAIKWRQIISPLQQLTFYQAMNAILAGVAFALNTPNRIGEYGARILYIEEGKRAKAISLTIISSFSQLIVTMISGFIASVLMYDQLKDSLLMNSKFSWSGMIIGIVLFMTIISIVIYFNISRITILLLKLPIVKRLSVFLQEVRELSFQILWKSLVLSIFRYFVFLMQYILLLKVMHVEIPFLESIGLVSILFLILAIIPTVALLELGIRWQLGIMLFGIYSSNVLGIYMVASAIWVFNLLIPAILGSFSILRIRIFKVHE